jgi:uncharacterized membrane protein
MIALALLAAASPAPDYRALGTEPFWSLTIARGGMRLSEPGRPDAVMATPPLRRTSAGRCYASRAVVVEIVRGACSDGMSDRRYPERVTVRWRGRVLKGCGGMAQGGEASAPVVLDGTAWRIDTIDGRRVTLGPGAVTLRFEGDRVTGQAGCNRLAARWRLDRGHLAITEIAMTRRACVGESERIETRFTTLAAAPLAVTRQGEAIVLSNAAGAMTLARL